jgi:signal peptidase II
MYLLFVVLIVIDQITKAFFADSDFFFLVIHIQAAKNYALPFGFDFGNVWNLIILGIIYMAAGWMLYIYQYHNKWAVIGKMMFFAGAASNLADRLIYGFVRDFININLGFVFNLADVFIVVGLVLALAFSTKDLNSGKIPVD